MRFIGFLLSLGLAAAGPPASASAVQVYGIGGRTCGYALGHRSAEAEIKTWMLGYWSGLNTMTAERRPGGGEDDAQWATSAATIWAEVKGVCTDDPTLALSDAINAVYGRAHAGEKSGFTDVPAQERSPKHDR